MEKGRRMRRSRRSMGLNGLFWRYLITTGLLAGTLCLLWLFLFNVLVNMEFVMSAYTAARALPDTEKMLRAQERFEPEEIPFFYEWALVEDGSIIQSSMSQKQLEYAYDELAGYSAPHGWLYTQHFHFVPLSDGKKVMLEYDYSVCYADPKLQELLPDFQLCYIGLLLVLLVLLIVMCTGHYTRILRKDTQAVAAACEMVRQQRLEEPLTEAARVKELAAALDTIDTLRSELAASLKERWAAEQQKNETLAALAHDLKTPLTVILGNADLLAEDDLTCVQKEMAEAIVRNAEHAEGYVESLRDIAASRLLRLCRREVSFGELFSECVQRGMDLAAVRGQTVTTEKLPEALSEKTMMAEKDDVLRAVENLLGNASRFTPAGEKITIGAALEGRRAGIWVQDSGPGFSAEALAKAGKTFYTQDGSRPKEGHMGMGLYFVSRVARRHGGSLVLENTPAGGRACLWLELKEDGEKG